MRRRKVRVRERGAVRRRVGAASDKSAEKASPSRASCPTRRPAVTRANFELQESVATAKRDGPARGSGRTRAAPCTPPPRRARRRPSAPSPRPNFEFRQGLLEAREAALQRRSFVGVSLSGRRARRARREAPERSRRSSRTIRRQHGGARMREFRQVREQVRRRGRPRGGTRAAARVQRAGTTDVRRGQGNSSAPGGGRVTRPRVRRGVRSSAPRAAARSPAARPGLRSAGDPLGQRPVRPTRRRHAATAASSARDTAAGP